MAQRLNGGARHEQRSHPALKQWGSHDEHGKRMAKHAAGRTLDGRTWDEYPVTGGMEVVSA